MNHLYFRKTILPAQALVLVLLASCAAPATEIVPTDIPTFTPAPATISSPTRTAVPTLTAIPGLEGWSVFNASAVDIAVDGEAYILTLNRRALWFMDQRGVLIHQLVRGDFKITADVYTSKQSDPSQPPGGDGSVQLSGLMARNGKGGLENYVFIVVGDDGNGLSVETKNTMDSLSRYDGPSWGSVSAELRICRFGSTFNLYKRVVDSNDSWELADSFDRPDLPEELQVGVNIYTDSTPDLQARIENLRVEPLSSLNDCGT
jgi:hypothetical protein